MDQDIKYMQLALNEAAKGLGRTSPNPAVGAVIVKDNRIIGKGYHEQAGRPHAERNALAGVTESPRGATIYVTLEPCNHTGRTPPCTEAIIESGITRVVAGMTDPNPRVAGKGLERLRSHGLTVVSGVLEKECREINFPFIKYITTGLPWVIMKAGVSLDGKIAYRRGAGGKITGSEAHQHVHMLRDLVDAILVGVETALVDDPGLTTRFAKKNNQEKKQGKDPLRIVLDSHLRLSPEAKMLRQKSPAPTWIYCAHDAPSAKQQELENAGAVIWRINSGTTRVALEAVFQHLGQNNITSVLVEGGARIHGTLLREDLADQILLYYAPFFIGDNGVPVASAYQVAEKKDGITFVETSFTRLGRDFLFSGIRNYP